jgi:hypothetical protein
VKTALRAVHRWSALSEPAPGFSIVLGVPWDLRHLLNVNLRFVARTDLSRVREVFVVFDRREQPEMGEIAERTGREFPALPLTFLWYPEVAGRIVERVHVSTFYNSMNTTLAIGRCSTRHAVLHDFDLYPLRADHFTSIVDAMAANSWRFAGHELTHFDGLEDGDLQIGTWTLGVDAQWLRANYRPVDCFHRVGVHRGRRFNLDPFAWIQFRTPQRGLTRGFDDSSFCHVKNLCSTYLRFLKRAPLNVAWRMHYLWYLEELSGRAGRLEQVTRAMNESADGVLHVDQHPADFRTTHASCANVLRGELDAMEQFLFGATRESVRAYVDEFERFVHRHGDVAPIRDPAGGIGWSARFDRQGRPVAAGASA